MHHFKDMIFLSLPDSFYLLWRWR